MWHFSSGRRVSEQRGQPEAALCTLSLTEPRWFVFLGNYEGGRALASSSGVLSSPEPHIHSVFEAHTPVLSAWSFQEHPRPGGHGRVAVRGGWQRRELQPQLH